MEEKNTELKVTSLEQLKNYAQGSVVSLPPFADDQPFVARLKRPSLFKLIKTGKIPNRLMTQANKLFANGTMSLKTQVADDKMMDDLFTILDAVCEDSFVEPTFQQIKDAGVYLTDQQKMFVFSYMQSGVEALESFRSQR